MAILNPILLIILGILATAPVIIARKPEAKDLIEKIVPFQGFIGVFACIWGIWGIIQMILHIKLLSINAMLWSLGLATAIVMAILGMLLGFSLIAKYALSGSDEAMAKGQALRATLTGYQTPLGYAAIGLGIFYLVWSLI